MTAEAESKNKIIAATRLAVRRRRVRTAMIFCMALTLVIGPYLFFRASSFSERIKIVRLPGLPENEQTAAKFDGRLTVAVWNIAHGRGTAQSNWEEKHSAKVTRVIQIGTYIRNLDADVVILNEVDFSSTWSGGVDQAYAIAQAADFPYYARQSNLDFGFLYGRWKFGNVILSRYPITSATAVDLPPHKKWEDWLAGRKRGVLCTVDPGAGYRFNVIGLHLESRSETTRLRSVEFLVDLVSSLEGPLIVGGDLNTTPSGAPRSNQTPAGINAFDTLTQKSGLQSEPMTIRDSGQLTFPSREPSTAIDWILFDPDDFESEGQQVLQSDLSDHLPVVMKLRLKRFLVERS